MRSSSRPMQRAPRSDRRSARPTRQRGRCGRSPTVANARPGICTSSSPIETTSCFVTTASTTATCSPRRWTATGATCSPTRPRSTTSSTASTGCSSMAAGSTRDAPSTRARDRARAGARGAVAHRQALRDRPHPARGRALPRRAHRRTREALAPDPRAVRRLGRAASRPQRSTRAARGRARLLRQPTRGAASIPRRRTDSPRQQRLRAAVAQRDHRPGQLDLLPERDRPAVVHDLPLAHRLARVAPATCDPRSPVGARCRAVGTAARHARGRRGDHARRVGFTRGARSRRGPPATRRSSVGRRRSRRDAARLRRRSWWPRTAATEPRPRTPSALGYRP